MGYHERESSDYSDANDVQIKKPHPCSFAGCSASFSKKSKLLFHIRKHTGERPYACDRPGCEKTYTNSAHLRRHKKVFHEQQKEEIMCGYEGCHLVLSKNCLKKHISRKHNPDRKFRFQCSMCPKGFHKKKQLQQHTYEHTGEPAFACDKCNIKFTTSYSLNKHKHSHRSYTCEDCNNVFERWSLLLAHRKICRQFTCKDCAKTFKFSWTYKEHLVTHENKVNRLVYPCPREGCDRFYFYKRNLRIHIKHFHENGRENLQLKCSYAGCSAVLKTRINHKRHMLLHSMEKKKKVRKTRWDKGSHKYSMVALLTGFVEANSEQEENEISEAQSLDKIDLISKSLEQNTKVPEDTLLQECDKSLKMLQDL